MLIYKILRAPEWADLQARGETLGAPIDVSDGYIHFSTAAQVPGTLERHFSGEAGLMLLAYEAEALSPLKWEAARNGALFPHLYGPLRLSGALWHKPVDVALGSLA